MRPDAPGRHRLGFAAAFAAALGINVFALAATWHPLAFWDQWESVREYQRVLANGLAWRDLFAQHNEHRIVFSRLLALADHHFFRGLSISLVLASIVASFASALIIARNSGASRLGVTGRTRTLLLLAIATSVAQIGNLSWPFQTAWFLVETFALGAIACYAKISELPSGAREAHAALFVSCVVATAATFSSAHGQVVWLVLALLGVLFKYPLRVQLTTVFAGAIAIALYFLGYRPPGEHPSVLVSLRHPIDIAEFTTRCATNSVQLLGKLPQIVLGAGLLAVLAAALFDAIRARTSARAVGRPFLLGLLLFQFGIVGATALGRASMPGGAAYANEARYATHSVFLVFGAVLEMGWRLKPSVARERVVLGALTMMILLMTWSGFQGRAYSESVAMLGAKLAVAGCAESGCCSAETQRLLYPSAEVVRDGLSFLREHGLGHFAVHALVPAEPLQPVRENPHLLPDCGGFVDAVERTSDGLLSPVGWMVWSQGTERPSAISAITKGGVRIGGGGVCEPRIDVQEHLHVLLRGRHRLFGFRTWVTEHHERFFLVGYFGTNGDRRCKLAVDPPGR